MANGLRISIGLAALAVIVLAQSVPPGIGKGWLPEFDHAATQINALAAATPADKFTWRPAPGVRSVSEVYMHIAVGNYFILSQAGLKPPPEIAARLKPDSEESVTSKADVIQWLKDSQDFVRTTYPKIDRKKKVNFLGNDTDVDGVLLRLLVHNHEHMGQSIAYARMVGVVPPWSAAPGR